MRYIESKHISEGMAVATPLYNSKGRMLLAANTRVTASKKSMNPADALENLMANIGSMFDASCVEALRDNVALYPVGSSVRLSNGVTAWVQENRRGYPTRPLLRTRTGLSIDLMQRLNLVITGFADDCSACLAMTA